eukprot:TRINITY_DN2401_c0_g1_i4.p1 TRINITY_DN2401_c0_g1~~TRINITY_DN2401_c0_g1_i4.p1  ORF type:complete len:1509 (-),score=386.44 TRINITY_DN2401_c0_g1_i4:835-4707(-)
MSRVAQDLGLSEKTYTLSVTEQEVYRGLLDDGSNAQSVFCFHRHLDGLEEYLQQHNGRVDAIAAPFVDAYAAEREGGVLCIDSDSQKHLSVLQTARLPAAVPTQNIRHYHAKWVGQAGQPMTTDHLEALSRDVVTLLRPLIEDEIRRQNVVDNVEKEVLDHFSFSIERSKTFVGRAAYLEKISQYLGSDSTSLFVVHGKSGAGKTSLIAKAVLNATESATSAVIYRFIGATPSSSDGLLLLVSLCEQLGRLLEMSDHDVSELLRGEEGAATSSGQNGSTASLGDSSTASLSGAAASAATPNIDADSSETLRAPDGAAGVASSSKKPHFLQHARSAISNYDFDTLSRLLELLLARASAALGTSTLASFKKTKSTDNLPRTPLSSVPRLIIILDALDQMSASHNARSLSWLPTKLPPRIKIVVSVLENVTECYSLLRRRLPASSFLALQAFDDSEGSALLSQWLAGAQRTLTPHHRDFVLQSFQRNPLPLFLKLAFEECRRWASFDQVAPLPHTMLDIIGVLFSRLMKRHGKLLVMRSLGLLVATKHGITEDELLDVLSCDEELLENVLVFHKPDPRRLPVVLWSRLFLDLEPYLCEKRADGTEVLNFYHRQFREAAEHIFLTDPSAHANARTLYSLLDRYFSGAAALIDKKPVAHQPLRLSDKLINLRKLSELPHAQINARNEAGLENDTLGSLDFLSAQAQAGRTVDALADFASALSGDLSPPLAQKLRQFESFLRLQQHVLAIVPSLLPQQAANMPDAHPASNLAKAQLERRVWVKWVNKPQKPSRLILSLRASMLKGGVLNAAALTKDDKYILTAAQDGYAMVFSTKTATAVSRVVLHDGEAVKRCFWLPFNPTEATENALPLCVTASYVQKKARVIVWDPLIGEPLFECDSAHNSKKFVTFSGNGALCCIPQDDDKTLVAWNLSARTKLRTFVSEAGCDLPRVLGNDGIFIYCLSDTLMQAESVFSNSTVAVQFEGHSKLISFAVLSEDSHVMCTVSTLENLIHVWDVKTGKKRQTFSPIHHSSEQSATVAVYVAAISPDKQTFAAVCQRATIKLWNVDTGQLLHVLSAHLFKVLSVSFSGDSRLLASSSPDRTVRVWDIAHGTQLCVLTGHADRVFFAGFSHDGSKVFSGCDDRHVRLFEAPASLAEQKQQQQQQDIDDGQQFHSQWVNGVRLSVNESASASVGVGSKEAAEEKEEKGFGVSCASDGTLRVWSLKHEDGKTDNGKPLYILAQHEGRVTACDARGTDIISSGSDGLVIVWRDGHPLHVMDGHQKKRSEVLCVSEKYC